MAGGQYACWAGVDWDLASCGVWHLTNNVSRVKKTVGILDVSMLVKYSSDYMGGKIRLSHLMLHRTVRSVYGLLGTVMAAAAMIQQV